MLQIVAKVDSLIKKLNQQKIEAKKSTAKTYTVGFSADYAAAVHEAVGMVLQGQPRPSGIGLYWDPQGRAQAKFLETAVRRMRYTGEVGKAVARTAKNTKSVLRGLRSGAIVIRNEAQRMVPVETGYLKASAFIRVEHGA